MKSKKSRCMLLALGRPVFFGEIYFPLSGLFIVDVSYPQSPMGSSTPGSIEAFPIYSFNNFILFPLLLLRFLSVSVTQADTRLSNVTNILAISKSVVHN